MSDWAETTLGDLITLQRGFDITKASQSTGLYPVISSSGVTSFHDQFMVEGPGVVIGRKGTLGTAFFVSDNYWPHDTTLWVKDFKGNDAKFIYYLLQILSLEKLDSGSANPTLNRNYAHLVKLETPDATAQKEIATVLSVLDAKIDLNNRINAELEALAKTIYDYWFVQFDFPNANGRPYKSSGGTMVWNSNLKREIPSQWEVRPLSALIAKQKNGEWGAGEAGDGTDTQVICIRGADINALNGSGELKAPRRYISPSRHEKFLSPYDVVIEISGGSPTQSTGRAALISPEVTGRFDIPLVCSNFCKALTLNSPEQAHHFLQYWNALYSADVFFGWEGKTSGIKNLQFDSFMSDHNVPVPPENLTRSFHDFSRRLEQRKQNSLRENQELSQLRDWLLPLLMNGQVRVA